MSEEENVDIDEATQRPKKKKRKGGMKNRFEPINIEELITSPTILACFQELGCHEFCKKVQNIQTHPQLTNLFALKLHKNQVHLAGVKF